ncbi:hypothetical protein UPYG_G00237960 [Umbra pygmaea]|uniref:Uncharacterized protein n=1 Tax=Umbra pygmaea TaxID=75934 RepID=A0ABD0X586_UMBPY
MFQRLYDQREAVGAALSTIRTDITAMSSGENEAICQSLSTLAPFNHATVELSAESNVSASKVIPMVRKIQHQVALKLTGTTNPTAAGLCAKLLGFLKAIHCMQAATFWI